MTLFVSFEGTEGSGKTTQIALLAQALRDRGYDVVETREPGGTPLGESLRAILLESRDIIHAETEAYLMTAARSEHVRQVVRPALDRGAVVLCDRFADSTIAYQGAGRGIPTDSLFALQELAVSGCWPDLTILLDVPVEVGLKRREIDGHRNRIDRESDAFHARVAAWFREAARQDVRRWRVVDATRPVDLVHTAVLTHVCKRLEAETAVRHGSRMS